MFKELFKNLDLSFNLLFSSLLSVLLVAFAVVERSVSFLVLSFFGVFLVATSIATIVQNKRRNAKNTSWKNSATAKQLELDKEIQETTAELSEAKAEIVRLNEELKKKEKQLKDAENVEAALRQSLKNANDELATVRQQKTCRTEAIHRMLRSISEAVKLAYDAPTEHAGEDLKNIRFCVLGAALEGFDALEAFTWTDHVMHPPKRYRDFVHMALGERKLNPRSAWASEMILLAHNKSIS